MVETKVSLIGFPLMVMFLIVLVNVGSFTGTSSESFFGTRTVTDLQSELFDNFVNESYDNWGENPNSTRDGGDWNQFEGIIFIGFIVNLQNDEFGTDEEGHRQIASDLRSTMQLVYTENSIRVGENDVRFHISVDPESLREWEELNAANIRFDANLIFLGVIIGMVGLVGLVGIRIFGFGLADTSILFIIKVTGFVLLWGLLSLGSSTSLMAFPVVGAVLWIFMTLIYTFGVFLVLSEVRE